MGLYIGRERERERERERRRVRRESLVNRVQGLGGFRALQTTSRSQEFKNVCTHTRAQARTHLQLQEIHSRWLMHSLQEVNKRKAS